MRGKHFLPVVSLGFLGLSSFIPTAAFAQSSSTATKLVDAGKVTAAASTMTYEMNATMVMNVGGKTTKGTITASGQIDRKAQAASIEMDMGSFMKSLLSGAGANTNLPPAFNDPANMRMKVISKGSKVWMSFPLLSLMGGGTAGKPWVAIDAKELGVDARQLAASQGVDPTAGLDVLQGLSNNATVIGTEQVKGVKTTRYKGTADFASLAKNLPPKQAAEAKKLFGTKSSMPVEVWLDDQGRARRMDISFATNLSGITMTMNTQYFFMKFGEPVTITAPPASQIGENPLLLQQIKQQAAAGQTLPA